MKKLLIASTALVATAGMASADITISGHAAAGIYSGLGNKRRSNCSVPAVAADSCSVHALDIIPVADRLKFAAVSRNILR